MELYEGVTLVFAAIAGLYSLYCFFENRSKEYEDKLFAIKLELYDKIIYKVHAAMNLLDPGSAHIQKFFDDVAGPFAKEQYQHDPQEALYQEHISPLFSTVFDLNELLERSQIYLPDYILSEFEHFTLMVNQYLLQLSFYDSGTTVSHYYQLTNKKELLREGIRSDLRINHLDRRLKGRLKRIMPSIAIAISRPFKK